jgi:hypothetical protein
MAAASNAAQLLYAGHVKSSTSTHVLIAVIASTGCHKTVDNEGFEKTLAAKVTALGMTPGKVTCPPGIAGKKGATFACQIQLEKSTYDLEVTITDVHGDQLSMDTRWAKGDAVFSKKLAANLPKPMSDALGATVTVDCGSEPLLFLQDSKTKCKLSAGKTTSTLELTFDDKFEVNHWKLTPPLLKRAKLEHALTPAVSEKVHHEVTVDCGAEDLIPRPDDGLVWCGISDGSHKADIRVAITPELDVGKWEVATKP